MTLRQVEDESLRVPTLPYPMQQHQQQQQGSDVYREGPLLSAEAVEQGEESALRCWPASKTGNIMAGAERQVAAEQLALAALCFSEQPCDAVDACDAQEQWLPASLAKMTPSKSVRSVSHTATISRNAAPAPVAPIAGSSGTSRPCNHVCPHASTLFSHSVRCGDTAPQYCVHFDGHSERWDETLPGWDGRLVPRGCHAHEYSQHLWGSRSLEDMLESRRAHAAFERHHAQKQQRPSAALMRSESRSLANEAERSPCSEERVQVAVTSDGLGCVRYNIPASTTLRALLEEHAAVLWLPRPGFATRTAAGAATRHTLVLAKAMDRHNHQVAMVQPHGAKQGRSSCNADRLLPDCWRLPRFEYLRAPLDVSLREAGVCNGDWLEAIVLASAATPR